MARITVEDCLEKIPSRFDLILMSSKRAMRQAQKQAFAKHRSNITNSRFELKKKFIKKNKEEKKK